MKYFFIALLTSFTFSSCSHYYYIVRHGEKAVQEQHMSSDVPLSAAGEQRARDLKEVLKSKSIKSVYSTNTIRTRSTAQPTADYFNLSIQLYNSKPDSSFISQMKSKNENILIVGHSNTIDDIVNKLCGETKVPGDLSEKEFDNLFIVKKKGKKFVFIPKKYGVTTQ